VSLEERLAKIEVDIRKIKVALLDDKAKRMWQKIEPLISQKKMSPSDLSNELNIPRGTIFSYIRIFEEVGLVTGRFEGRNKIIEVS